MSSLTPPVAEDLRRTPTPVLGTPAGEIYCCCLDLLLGKPGNLAETSTLCLKTVQRLVQVGRQDLASVIFRKAFESQAWTEADRVNAAESLTRQTDPDVDALSDEEREVYGKCLDYLDFLKANQSPAVESAVLKVCKTGIADLKRLGRGDLARIVFNRAFGKTS